MAASPPWKVYMGRRYLGATVYPEDAARLVCGVPDGTVRYGHRRVVWREGHEDVPTGESFDRAAAMMQARLTQTNRPTGREGETRHDL